MGKRKFRKPALAKQDWQFGTSGSYTKMEDDGVITQAGTASAYLGPTTVGGGTSLSNIMCGSVSLAGSALTVGSTFAITSTITGLTTGHKVFVSGFFGASPGIHLIAACATAANTLTACFFCSLSDVGASPFVIQYLAVKDQ